MPPSVFIHLFVQNKNKLTMQKKSIEDLRHALLNEPEFAEIFACYMAWLEENHVMAFDTPRITNYKIMEAVKIGLGKYYETNIVFKHMRMHHVKSIHLFHGAGEAQGNKNIQVVLFYFEDMDMGLVSSIEAGSNVEGLVRFQIISEPTTSDPDLIAGMN
jgi:hypothetical protein